MAVEPPYGVIWREINQGKVIPFLGAGASFSGRPEDFVWEKTGDAYLPSGYELAHFLAEYVTFPSNKPQDRDNLAKVASYYLEADGRPGLVSLLCEIFCQEYAIGKIHRFLAEIEKPLLIITTNYDDLIEQAFREAGRDFHLVVHPTDRPDLEASVLWWQPGADKPVDHTPKELPLSLGDTSIIYKMHGSVDRHLKQWDSFVITEEDYVEFLARMTGQTAIPARFLFRFRQSRFLFLGYGLRDWNLRVMLKSLESKPVRVPADEVEKDKPQAYRRRDGEKSWAIQHQPSDLERVLWTSRGMNLYSMTIDDFVDEMQKRRIGS